MTQEQKAKAYDEALERAKDFMNGEAHYELKMGENIMCWVFPELRESEDDRIKKELITHCRNTRCVTEEEAEKIAKWLAWIEKQGGIDNCPLECSTNTVMTDSKKNQVEPRFKVGDWIVQGSNILKIRCVGDEYYCFETVGGYVDDMLVSEIDSSYHLWTIQDAKDGDVLNSPSHHLIWIYKDIQHHYACVNMNYVKENFFPDGFIVIPTDVCPATKDEQTILFAKMKERGYEWDAKRKELKKIEQKSVIWSEVDEDFFNDIITFFKDTKNALDHADWLKSLKQRCTWKPSDEQIHAFEQVYYWYNNNFAPSETLTSLYNDLKKLKG